MGAHDPERQGPRSEGHILEGDGRSAGMTGSEGTGATEENTVRAHRGPQAWRWAQDTQRAASSRRDTCPPHALRHWKARGRSQLAQAGFLVRLPREPCSPGLLLAAFEAHEDSSLFLGPPLLHWCKLTAARETVCEGPGPCMPRPQPSYRAWVCLKREQPLLGPRSPSHTLSLLQDSRGPVKAGRVGA